MPTALTTLDFLYISLSVAVLVLATVMTILIVHVTFLLRDVRKVTKTAGDITQKVNSLVNAPIGFITSILEHIKPHIEAFIKRKTKKTS